MTKQSSFEPELSSLLVRPDATILHTISVISRGPHKIAFVIDEETRLLGVVTDYDLRRAILNHENVDSPVSKIMEPNPIVAHDNASNQEMIDLISRYKVHQHPVIDSQKRLVGFHCDKEYIHYWPSQSDEAVVIMAGGLGSRLLPMTEDIPKPLLHVGGRTH